MCERVVKYIEIFNLNIMSGTDECVKAGESLTLQVIRTESGDVDHLKVLGYVLCAGAAGCAASQRYGKNCSCVSDSASSALEFCRNPINNGLYRARCGVPLVAAFEQAEATDADVITVTMGQPCKQPFPVPPNGQLAPSN